MNPTVDRDVENLVQVILEYCPNVVVLIRSQRNPVLHNFPTVQLKPLDAADLRTYLLEHERARRDLISASAIDLLLRHTDGIREILLPVVKAPKSKSDFYNRTRAALRLAEISLKNGEKLSDVDLLYLIGAYHYLFNERLSGLFDQCHDCLWKTFETSNDLANLLILFRHSSLYWRLSGRDTKERSYLKKIAKQIGETISEKLSNLGREAAYYLARATTSSQRPATKISEKNTGVS